MKDFKLKWEFDFDGVIYGDFVAFSEEPTKEQIQDASVVLLDQATRTHKELIALPPAIK